MLITGTPGTGKTTLAAQIAEATGLRHLCVGDMVRSAELPLNFIPRRPALRSFRRLPRGVRTEQSTRGWASRERSAMPYTPCTRAARTRVPKHRANRVLLLALRGQIKEKKYHAGKDEEFDSYVLDEPSEDAVSAPRRTPAARAAVAAAAAAASEVSEAAAASALPPTLAGDSAGIATAVARALTRCMHGLIGS